jgi:16S rRNA processing protein RimM
MFLIPPGFTGDISSAMPIEITSSWLPVGKNKGRVVLHLAGIDTISEAETRTGFEIAIPDDQRTPLEDESLYISDLIGCSLFDRTENIGTVTEVEFPATSDGSKIPDAPALIAVQTGNDQEILIPFVKAFIQEIDLPARRLVMNLPAGLIEMNQKI